MLNAKSLGTEKDITLNNDLSYTNGSLVEVSDKIRDYSDSFFTYNNNIGIFGGWIQVKGNVTLNSSEKLLKLPVMPKCPNVFVIGFFGSQQKAFYVDKDGYLVSNAVTVIPSGGADYYIIGSFGIGGGYSVE